MARNRGIAPPQGARALGEDRWSQQSKVQEKHPSSGGVKTEKIDGFRWKNVVFSGHVCVLFFCWCCCCCFFFRGKKAESVCWSTKSYKNWWLFKLVRSDCYQTCRPHIIKRLLHQQKESDAWANLANWSRETYWTFPASKKNSNWIQSQTKL